MRNTTSLLLGSILCATALAAQGADDVSIPYRITITNLTRGQPIAPVMAATHRPSLSFFQPGSAPTPELAALAEAGDGRPMAEKLLTMKGFSDAQIAEKGIMPGESVTMTVTAQRGMDHLSIGAMLGNTNDAFIALRDVKLPQDGKPIVYEADAYDAGSETNDESCSTVPGPACGGVALSPEDAGEGFTHIHPGIHGIGGLNPSLHDWRNPSAQVVVARVIQ